MDIGHIRTICSYMFAYHEHMGKQKHTKYKYV